MSPCAPVEIIRPGDGHRPPVGRHFVDPQQPIFQVASLDSVVSQSVAARRFHTGLIDLFAAYRWHSLELSLTIENLINGKFSVRQVGDDIPTTISHCSQSDLLAAPKPNQCFTEKYASFLNETKSAIIYDKTSLKITEEGRLYVKASLLPRFCRDDFRPALEFMNFVRELCDPPR